MVRRLLKIVLMASFSVLFTLFVLNNITNFNSNYHGVESVMSMEGIMDIHLKSWRAVTDAKLHMAVYYAMVGWQILTSILCWAGTVALIINYRSATGAFARSKRIAFLGLGAGFLFFMVGFVIIGSEWFYMWQSVWNNLQLKSLLFSLLLLTSILFLSSSD